MMRDGRTDSTSDGCTSTKFPCGQCLEECKSGSLQCHQCAIWFHNDCVRVPSSILSQLKKVPGLLWKCQSCNKSGETFPISTSKFDEKFDSYFKVLKSESESLLTRTIESFEVSLKPIKESLALLQKSIAELKSSSSKTLPSSAQDSVKSENMPNVPTSHQFRIDGIYEFDLNSDKTGQYRKKLLDHDYHSLSDILDFIGESPTIVDLRRIGKFKSDQKRPRTLLVCLSNPWDVKKILSKGYMLKEYGKPIFLSRALNREEQTLEHELIKTRRELINAGESPKNIKIRDLKLIVKGKEFFPSTNEEKEK